MNAMLIFAKKIFTMVNINTANIYMSGRELGVPMCGRLAEEWWLVTRVRERGRGERGDKLPVNVGLAYHLGWAGVYIVRTQLLAGYSLP